MCSGGEIGKRVGLRNLSLRLRVRVSPAAPKDKTLEIISLYDNIIVGTGNWGPSGCGRLFPLFYLKYGKRKKT